MPEGASIVTKAYDLTPGFSRVEETEALLDLAPPGLAISKTNVD